MKLTLEEDAKIKEGDNLNYLMDRQLHDGQFLGRYIGDHDGKTINNFLRSKPVADMSDPSYQSGRDEDVELAIQRMKKGWFLFPPDYVQYYPITPDLVQELIEVDEMFRASKTWHTEPITVYRGTVDGDDLKSLNSTSTDLKVAESNSDKIHEKGCLMEIRLPAHFPFIPIAQINPSTKYESEVLLPPCDYKVIEQDPNYKTAPYRKPVRRMVIEAYPINLAKYLLYVMENPPIDYPIEYIEDPIFGWEKSKQMLRDYITKYVDTGTIQMGSHIFTEHPDPMPTKAYTR